MKRNYLTLILALVLSSKCAAYDWEIGDKIEVDQAEFNLNATFEINQLVAVPRSDGSHTVGKIELIRYRTEKIPKANSRKAADIGKFNAQGTTDRFTFSRKNTFSNDELALFAPEDFDPNVNKEAKLEYAPTIVVYKVLLDSKTNLEKTIEKIGKLKS